MAGSCAKPATIPGATEDFGFNVAENPVHVHDLHATAPHLTGRAREKLTYRYAGRFSADGRRRPGRQRDRCLIRYVRRALTKLGKRPLELDSISML